MSKVNVNTLRYFVTCGRLNPPTNLVTIESCARCKHHQGIRQLWPRRDGAIVEVDISEVSVEPAVEHDTPQGRNFIYDVICAQPRSIPAQLALEFINNEEAPNVQ